MTTSQKIAKRPARTAAASAANPADTATQTLTAQWFNAVVTGLNLDGTTFQLIQGALPLGSTSAQLWGLFDAVPPMSANSHYNPSGIVSFSQTYADIVANLVTPPMTQFQTAMGDYYTQWTSYLSSNPITPPATYYSVLTNWSNANMPPAQAARAQTAYKQIWNNAVTVATTMWDNMQGATSNPGVAAYTVTIEDVENALPSGSTNQTATIGAATDTTISNNFSGGYVEGGWDLFGVVDEGTNDALTTAFTANSVTATATFSQVVTVPGTPLSQPDPTDPILTDYTPWYYSPALNMAYQTSNNTVWQAGGDVTWNGTFGPSGDLPQLATELIVVSGMTLTITSETQFSSSQQSQFQSSIGGGFWPFYFGASSQSGSSSVSFTSSGIATVTVTVPAGNPLILGVTVTPMSEIFPPQS
jgi:hypothetical protein